MKKIHISEFFSGGTEFSLKLVSLMAKLNHFSINHSPDCLFSNLIHPSDLKPRKSILICH